MMRAATLFLGLLLVPAFAGAQTLIPFGASWRYLDDGSDQGTAWQARTFADAGWALGPAELGYGDGDEATVVSFGGNSSDKHITTYFRQHFNVADPNTVPALALSLLRDDGAIVYLNGAEVFRTNMPGGAVDSETPALTAIGGSEETDLHQTAVFPGLLVSGDNVLAVEIHQSSGTSSDISIDAELVVGPPPGTPSLLRGPYLQLGLSDGVTVRWRTDEFVDSVVKWGPAPTSLDFEVSIPGTRTEHEISIAGLAADTRFYYSVGSSSVTLAGGDFDHFFDTSPLAGAPEPTRIWVIGDSGDCATSNQGCIDAGAVRDAYLTFAGTDTADVWLMLGDNAYNTGTDQQYTAGVFDVYQTVLRNTVLWPAPGNHEFGVSDSPTQAGPYYDTFTMPTAAEAGGVMSGTEAYYSFDYANVHFVSLDSHDTSRALFGPMYNWLVSDLSATSQQFVIVYWHHPPYTKGSHDSDDPNDSGGRMKQMRERFLPVLEQYSVDLQLTGHSHSYERSILIDGHYDVSSTFGPQHIVDGGDGDPNGDGAYFKEIPGPGTIYSVVGSSSMNSGGASLHAAMQVVINYEGSLVVDVTDDQLDGYFIDKDGLVDDRFRLIHDSDGDSVRDADDNCPLVPNAGQEASTQDGLVGRGCACLCGDVNNSCSVSGIDAQRIRFDIVITLGLQAGCYDIGDPPFDEQGLCGTPQDAEPRGCDVNASGTCSGLDAQVILESMPFILPGATYPLASGYDPANCAQASADPSP